MDSAPPPGFIIVVVVSLLQLAMRALRDYEATQLAIEQERAKQETAGDRRSAEYVCVSDGTGHLRGLRKAQR